MTQPEINTMILGQTGVGKSSLINYLYGADVVRVGTGKPVTRRGDFTKISIPSPFKSDVKINIFDSWGLESDKAEDWEAVIDAKLSAELSFDEMIYAIVYCSSYANDRIQDFEIRMLKKLLSKQYKVTIALTNADNSGFETKKKVFREKFAKELAEYRGDYSVVDICAEAKPKLGQSAASARIFGKEDLFKELEKDFLTNFVNVVYARWTDWKDESLAKLKDFRKRGIASIEDFKGGLLDTNKDRAKQIADHINNEMQTLIGGIQGKIKGAIEDFKTWYEQAAGAFYQGNLGLEISTGIEPLDIVLVFVKYSLLSIPLTIFDKL
ncbi:MAG: GTPase domain-containing protein, partial [Spirochaetales bacterium]|nr:GTPase domain-containing protein [Spirochaetales bacterium]